MPSVFIKEIEISNSSNTESFGILQTDINAHSLIVPRQAQTVSIKLSLTQASGMDLFYSVRLILNRSIVKPPQLKSDKSLELETNAELVDGLNSIEVIVSAFKKISGNSSGPAANAIKSAAPDADLSNTEGEFELASSSNIAKGINLENVTQNYFIFVQK